MISVFLQLDDFRESKIRRFHSTSQRTILLTVIPLIDAHCKMNVFIRLDNWPYNKIKLVLMLKFPVLKTNGEQRKVWRKNALKMLYFMISF